jgi:two-component system sensor histidine kinase DesK
MRSVIWSITTSWELRAARDEIARLAVMNERLRIARDLHDLLGHNLSLITLKSELAGRLLSIAPQRAAAEIHDIENVARTTLQEVREAVASYRLPTLASELHAAQEILTAAGIAYRYEGDEQLLENLPAGIEAVLSWTVREGITNVVKHSRAHQCLISLRRDSKHIYVEISDDGTGDSNDSSHVGNGLRGLAERVTALGGHFEAGPRAGSGFSLSTSIPINQKSQNSQNTANQTVIPMENTPTTTQV